ncbi:MAG: zf-HC2 domain-containing protein [Acidobacteria bacterium]|nr:zf-HC2 domain-containing protein [Acidobacteriota bacterium]
MKPQNNCQRKEDLVTYLYGELTPSEEKNFKEHLNICSSCKKEASEFGMLRENLQTWQVEETPRVVLDLPTTQRPRSLKEILQELGSILPAWFKYGTGFAAACAASLLLLAVFNTQIRYDQNGFSFNVALFNSSNSKNIIVNPQPNDEVARAMVTKILNDKEAQINQALEEKRSQIEKELRKQIDILSGELSQKSNTELSKVSLELKRQQRSDLEKALQQIQRQRTQETFSDDDDPFNLWGGVNNKVIERAMENTQTFEQSGQ